MYRPVQLRLSLQIVDVVQRQRSDNRVRCRQRIQKARFPKGRSTLKSREPLAGFGKHLLIDIEHGDARTGQAVEHRRGEGAGPAAQIEDVTVGGGERREQLDAGRDHLVVVRDETPDLDVITLGINTKMTLDRVRLTATCREGTYVSGRSCETGQAPTDIGDRSQCHELTSSSGNAAVRVGQPNAPPARTGSRPSTGGRYLGDSSSGRPRMLATIALSSALTAAADRPHVQHSSFSLTA